MPYLVSDGSRRNISLGPCLVEQGDGLLVDIVWGANGQKSAALPVEAMASAKDGGNLVLLD